MKWIEDIRRYKNIVSDELIVFLEKANSTWPNRLSVFRLVISITIIPGLLIYGRTREAAAAFLIAGFTDLLDGLIARYVGNQKSRFGAFIDPIADKALIIFPIYFIEMWLWIKILIYVREFSVIIITLIINKTNYEKAVGVTWSGKWKMFVQIPCIFYAILGFPGFNLVLLPAVVLAYYSGIEMGTILHNALKNTKQA